jgi:hypothetical protein
VCAAPVILQSAAHTLSGLLCLLQANQAIACLGERLMNKALEVRAQEPRLYGDCVTPVPDCMHDVALTECHYSRALCACMQLGGWRREGHDQQLQLPQGLAVMLVARSRTHSAASESRQTTQPALLRFLLPCAALLRPVSTPERHPGGCQQHSSTRSSLLWRSAANPGRSWRQGEWV